MEILKFATQESQITGIKKYLCDIIAAGNQLWLRKMRPFWRYNLHFYLHFKCQSGSPTFWSQPIAIKRSGRDSSLDWWFTDESYFLKKQQPKISFKVMMMSNVLYVYMRLISKMTP
ncbi:MAG: penicillin-insensitive murein endopeptidase [Candidatus Tokpelaia sp. JSC189]|nr:MAG: penicillin-insensitive murein endopeptidase [Candidatus Tokpelaia sp. JSC189]